MNLKLIREELGISQKELAEKLNVSHTNIYNYEVGRTEPSLSMLKQIAEVLGVSVGYLVGAEDEFGHAIPKDIPQRDKELLKAFHKLHPFEQETILIQINALAEKVKN